MQARRIWPLFVFVGSIAAAESFVAEPSVAPISGLMRIRGAAFGPSGTVSIGGRPAPVARWSDSLIECYVPAGIRTGRSPVLISPVSGRGTKGAIVVTRPEPSEGRRKWRFKMADQYAVARPATGPDGTIYVQGNFGHVYALDPAGILKWVFSPTGGTGGMIDVLPNGNVVVGGGGGVQCLSKEDGRRLWSYSINTPLLAGPCVGPDGLIYAADDSRWSSDVIGAFILDADGKKIWSGGEFYRRGGGWIPQPIRFGGGNAYFWSDHSSAVGNALGGMNAIQQGGGLRWRVDDGTGIMPDTTPSGNVSLFRPSSIESRDPNGNTRWSQLLYQFGGQPRQQAVVDAFGRTYFLTANNSIHAISSNGLVEFSRNLGATPSHLGVRHDGGQIALQLTRNFGLPYEIWAYNRNMVAQWSYNLPIEFGMSIATWDQLTYDPSGDTLFIPTAGPYTSATEAHCYLYALDAR